jgi:hypothetical protein
MNRESPCICGHRKIVHEIYDESLGIVYSQCNNCVSVAKKGWSHIYKLDNLKYLEQEAEWKIWAI